MFRTRSIGTAVLLIPFLAVTSTTSTLAQSTVPLTTPIVGAPRSDSLDRSVILLLSDADREEAGAARLALTTTRDPEVRKFAQRMIDEHNLHLTATTVIAARLKYPLAAEPAAKEPPGPTDFLYINGVVDRHQALLRQLPTDPATLHDQALRSLVAETRRETQAHLDDARQIQVRLAARTP